MSALENPSIKFDHTIARLGEDEIDRMPDIRWIVEALDIEPEDLLAYRALADGGFGRYRIVSLFLLPPCMGDPLVLCLDGPRGPAASEHRNGGPHLCLYYKDDPPERRWRQRDGLVRLFDLARRHVTAEHICRETGGDWPLDEAPHGETEPAPSDPTLGLAPLRPPRRGDHCSCGSGLKAKRCCFR